MTLQRVLVCISVLGLFACVRSDAAPKARRPSPTTEPVAAVVLHVGGSTTVRPATGTPFPAAVDQDLVRSDRLEPGEGAFAILGLQNGHVVRVDDAGALAVKDILLLQAPPTSRPVAEQLAQLLDPGERSQTVERGVVDRAAAWRQMRRAAETSGSRTKRTTRDEAKAAQAEEAGAAPEHDDVQGGGPVMSREAVAQAPATTNVVAAPAKDAPPPPKAIAPAAPPPPAEGSKKGMADVPGAPPPPPPAEPGVVVKAGATVAVAVPLTPVPSLGGGVLACLTQTATDVGVGPGAVTLWLQVKGGVVTRVRFAGALPVSSCAAALAGRAVAVADGWLVVEPAP